MAIINLNPGQLFSADPSNETRFANVALYLNRRLIAAAKSLAEIDLVFEASDAEELAEAFAKFALEDGSADGLCQLWNDLEDWAGATTMIRGREKVLCSVPNLPPEYSC